MAWQGQWQGKWNGNWHGDVDTSGGVTVICNVGIAAAVGYAATIDVVLQADTRRGRSTRVRFSPVQRAAGIVPQVHARGVAGVLAAAGFVGGRARQAAVRLTSVIGAAQCAPLAAFGVTRIPAAAPVLSATGRVGAVRLHGRSGAACRCIGSVAAMGSYRGVSAYAGAAGLACAQHGFGTSVLLGATGIKNLTDEELIGLFLSRRGRPLTGVADRL